jgi:hypothetical protein
MEKPERKPQQRQKPIPPEVAAVWGAYLHEGLLDALSTENALGPLDLQERSHREILVAACNCLPMIWAQMFPYWDSPVFDYPGDFESEVISELGSRFGEYFCIHGGALTEHQVQRIITPLIGEFLIDYGIVESPTN